MKKEAANEDPLSDLMEKESDEKTKPRRPKKKIELTATTTTITVDPETSSTITTITGGTGQGTGKLPLIELDIQEKLSECQGDRLWKKVLKMMGGEYAVALWVPRRMR